jgi:hypothetical protein
VGGRQIRGWKLKIDGARDNTTTYQFHLLTLSTQVDVTPIKGIIYCLADVLTYQLQHQ